MQNIFEIIKNKLSNREKDIVFPLQFFWTSGKGIVIFRMGNGEYLRIDLILHKENESAIEKSIHGSETQGGLLPGLAEFLKRYYAGGNGEKKIEAHSLESVVILAMEITRSYQLGIEVGSALGNVERRASEKLIDRIDEDKKVEFIENEAWITTYYGLIKTGCEEVLPCLKSLRGIPSFTQEQLQNIHTKFYNSMSEANRFDSGL